MDFLLEKEYRRVLATCPLQILHEGVTAEGEWQITVRNNGWCAVKSAQFCVLFPEGEKTVLLQNLPAGERQTVSDRAKTLCSHIFVEKVVYADGVVFENVEKAAGVSAEKPPKIDLKDSPLMKAAWGTAQIFAPERTKAYWSCGCGALNAPGQQRCTECGRAYAWVFAHQNEAVCVQNEKEETIKQEKRHRRAAHEAAKRRRHTAVVAWSLGIAGGALLLAAVLILLNIFWFRPAGHYQTAQHYILSADYFKAYGEFVKAGGYGDAAEQAEKMQRLLCSETRIAAGNYITVKTDDLGHTEGSGRDDQKQLLIGHWRAIQAVAVGENHTLGLHFDGTVLATGIDAGGTLAVEKWTDIAAIGAGSGFSVGLKKDGTAVACGKNTFGQCNLSEWREVTAISVGSDFVLGLRADGTVLLAGNTAHGGLSDVGQWSDIVYIAAGYGHALGVRADGSVVAAGDDTAGALETEQWTDIVAVTAGDRFSVGLKKDGTLCASGLNNVGQTSVDDVRDAVAVISGWNYTLSLQKDGSIVFFGDDVWGEGEVGGWSMS